MEVQDHHARPRAANLVEQNFDVPTPSTLWASDITYVPTAEGWLYLAATRNLLQDGLELTGINQLWHVDITYIPTDEGWLYLAGVIDGFSKRVVGYAMAEHMKTELVVRALQSAVTKRNPAPGLIHQSDRGGQYTSHLYGAKLAARGLPPSFAGKGACFDNAVIESFWATLKRELVYPRECFTTRAEARAAIFEFIEIYYNRERLHSSLNYETPETYEHLQQLPVALARLAA